MKTVRTEQFINLLKKEMSESSTMNHIFLDRFMKDRLNDEQLRRFAIQWYKTARHHKEAFPALIYNIKDDDVRFDLIDILNEEYGTGNREKIHARLLQNFLRALGVSEEDVQQEPTLKEVSDFGQIVLEIWKDGNPVYAFGLHFALEFLAASLHEHFADGLEKYDFLSESDKEYFNYHKVAEVQHADFSENGMFYYGSDEENKQFLEDGVRKGIEILGNLWDGFYNHIFVMPKPAQAQLV